MSTLPAISSDDGPGKMKDDGVSLQDNILPSRELLVLLYSAYAFDILSYV